MQTSFFHWRYYVGVLAVIWTIIIGASLVWNLYQTKQKTLEVAYIQARITLEKDIQYRRWNSGHGGVYVPVTEETPSNPYLSHVSERDIKTPSGKILTLMNPAYMTRQVNEIAKKKRFFWGHLTSLKPIRPENAPDRWEADTLKAFERGETEVRSVENIEGQDYFRLMRPFRTEEPCLKCHSVQGYKKGEIRGGISVSSSMAALYALEWKSMRRVGATHLLIWLISLGVIGLMAQRINRSEAVRNQAEEALRISEERYRGLFEEIPIGMYRTTMDGRIIDANPALVQMLGYPDRDSLLAVNSSDTYVNLQARVTWKNLMEQQGIVRSYEKEMCRSDGTVIQVEENAQAICDLEGRVQYYQGSFQDITERKRAEEEREKLIQELQKTLAEVKTLSGLIPICASCKKIRNDKGYWGQIESYISDHSEAEFSHGICPDCMKKLYPDYAEDGKYY